MTVFYGLASVPLALHFLPVEEFGLFMLVIQISGYFSLIDIGMAGATARLLVDHKDDPNSESYSSLISTGFVVFALQAVLILVAGLLASSWIVAAVGVPAHLQDDATYLLRWLCVYFSVVTFLKMLNSALYAHQRLDIINAITGLMMLFGLLVMAVVLGSGGGLRGLAFVFLLQGLLTVILQGFACWSLRLLPERQFWRRPTFSQFMGMFRFAKDIFFLNIGSQILEASQLIIITRTMGLTAAAMWSVGTKIFNLLYQLITRIEGTAIVFFSEMMVRGETERLENRFRQIYQISAAVTVVTVAVAVAINKPFVSLWAEPTLAWPVSLSAIMALVVFFNVVTRCHVDLILHTKKLLGLRYLYLFEAILFLGLAFWLVSDFGLYGILTAALVCVVVVRFGYTSWRIADYLRIPVSFVCWQWLRRSVFTAAALGVFVATSGMILEHFNSPQSQLVVATLWTGIPATLVLFSIAMPEETKSEVLRNLSKQTNLLLGRFRFRF
jgi:O-antigen/teichoic acid export membrane protein